jgi:hypothetical protein
MVAYSPAAFFPAQARSTAMDLSQDLGQALWIDDLIALFSDAIGIEGGLGHGCYALEHGRAFLFGSGLQGGDAERAVFRLEGWDLKPYEVEIALAPGFADRQRRANLHAMSALYLCRGLALLDAADDVRAELTERERFCLEQYQDGRCSLDIGEDLDRSALAVSIHLERAERKLRRN